MALHTIKALEVLSRGSGLRRKTSVRIDQVRFNGFLETLVGVEGSPIPHWSDIVNLLNFGKSLGCIG